MKLFVRPSSVLLLVALLVLGACNKNDKSVMPDSGGVTPTEGPAPAKTSPTVPGDSAKLSLYVMSECPYGTPAEKVVQTVRQVLKNRLSVRLVFIVSQEASGEFSSLHGPTEIDKDIVQACVGKLAADKQLDFVVQMNEAGDWKKAAAAMQLDSAAIEQCTANDGKALLAEHFRETETLKVTSSPTIILNGGPYHGGMNSRDIFDAVCATFASGDAPAECAAPPETLSRTDGQASGSCGAEPEEQPLPPDAVDNTVFDHTVLYDPQALSTDRVDEVIKQTLRIFPKANVKKIDYSSREGKKIADKYQIKQLPAFLFPASLANLKNYKLMERYLKKLDDAYLLDPAIGANLFIARERQPRTVDVFFSPFSTKAMRVLLDVNDLLTRPEIQALKITINLRPYALIDAGQLSAKMGPPEVEEMMRELAVMKTAPNKIWDYIKVRYDNPLSSWWEDYITKVGLDAGQIKKLAQSDAIRQMLMDNSRLAEEVGAVEEIVLLFENRELARVEGKEQFRAMLMKLAKR